MHTDQSIYKTVNVDCVHIRSLREIEIEKEREKKNFLLTQSTRNIYTAHSQPANMKWPKEESKRKEKKNIGDFVVVDTIYMCVHVQQRPNETEKKPIHFLTEWKNRFIENDIEDITKRVKRYRKP